MPVYRSENGTFYSQCFYRDGRGAKRHKVKRGFATELEALMWEKDFLAVHNGTMDMLFADFVDVYATEIRPRIREHTWLTKEYMIKDKIIPFFGKMRMSEIKPIDVVRWQNQLIDHKDANGKPYSATYLRTINNQLNAIFNHAERYYDLTGNPCRKVTKMGSKKGGEMNFWTKQEYLRFSEAIMGQTSFLLRFRGPLLDRYPLWRAPRPHPIRFHLRDLGAQHHEVVSAFEGHRHHHRPEDSELRAKDRHAQVPRRGDEGVPGRLQRRPWSP